MEHLRRRRLRDGTCFMMEARLGVRCTPRDRLVSAPTMLRIVRPAQNPRPGPLQGGRS